MGEVDQITTISNSKPLVLDRKVRAQKEQTLNCPRCNSINTKFCYYNNYSLTQPRYLCKTCRRYWTAGGTLRNVPVGGGSRKNKRSPSSSSSSSPSIKIPDLINPPTLSHFSSQNPNHNNNNNSTQQPHDLNLAFPPPQNFHQFVKLPKTDQNESIKLDSSFLLTPMSMPMNSNTQYTPMFPLQEFIPASSGFSTEHGFGARFGGAQENMINGGRQLMFPFGSTTTTATTDHQPDHNKGQANSAGYWTGILGGGSW